MIYVWAILNIKVLLMNFFKDRVLRLAKKNLVLSEKDLRNCHLNLVMFMLDLGFSG